MSAPRHHRLPVSFTLVRNLQLLQNKRMTLTMSTDFEKTFIQAIVYNYNVLKELGDEATVKAQGKIMTKGKDYVVEDGDILLIKAGAAKG